MSTASGFRSLEDLLTNGADQSVARAYFDGASDADVGDIFTRRFSPITDPVRERIQLLGKAEFLSGLTANGSLTSGQFSIQDVPVNEFLFGDESGGNRVRVTFEVLDDEFEPILRSTANFPDLPDLADLFAELADIGIGIITKYPEKFGLTADQASMLENVRIVGITRKF